MNIPPCCSGTICRWQNVQPGWSAAGAGAEGWEEELDLIRHLQRVALLWAHSKRVLWSSHWPAQRPDNTRVGCSGAPVPENWVVDL